MVTARLIVRAQAEMADRCFLQDKEASRPPAMEELFFFFLRDIEGSHKKTDGRTYMRAQTIVPSWFDVSHSESHFYLKSQISINTGLDCCEKIAAGLVPTHLCEPLRAL